MAPCKIGWGFVRKPIDSAVRQFANEEGRDAISTERRYCSADAHDWRATLSGCIDGERPMQRFDVRHRDRFTVT
jgi:hypothetical protein